MEDLLQAQFDNEQNLLLFDAMATFSIHMLVHQINKSESLPLVLECGRSRSTIDGRMWADAVRVLLGISEGKGTDVRA